jgi:uncharacterized coiled-coil protein SlyX
VPAFDNLGDDSLLDVHEAPSLGRTMEKPVSPPPSMSVEFLHFGVTIFTMGSDDFFCRSYPSCTLATFAAGEPRQRPGVLPSSGKFCFASAFLCCRACSNRLIISQALALSEKQREKRVAESAHVAKIAELEVVALSQTGRIAELDATCADFKREKDKVTDGYRRLAEKHKSFAVKAKHEKTKLAEAHAAELTKLCADLDLETHNYTEYRQTMHHRLHELHEAVASSFEEVKAQCLPFPHKGGKVEEVIDWIVVEVKAVPDTV